MRSGAGKQVRGFAPTCREPPFESLRVQRQDRAIGILESWPPARKDLRLGENSGITGLKKRRCDDEKIDY